ncbi:MAG: histidine ammonia-lyase [Muribaculaceae bacterium]|nr:histidine ammonia-lyase [Muribaculaceae bacterium]
MNNTFTIYPGAITVSAVCEAVDSGAHIVISPEATALVERARKYLDDKVLSSPGPLYGINTGFGSLCNISISHDELEQLQKNLVMSHACGMGATLEPVVVKTMLLLKVQSLCYGNSGVQLATVERLVDFFNEDVIPVVYEQGSLGASGDLAPLANMCLPLLGLGEVWYKDERRAAAEVLREKGWEPLALMSKEGLALLNGTQFMSAHAVRAVYEAKRLLDAANHIGAMSLDAFDGRLEPFGALVNEVRHHRGQIDVAADVRTILSGSQLAERPKEHVQDPYSFRCIPQVHGAVLDVVRYVTEVINEEISSPTDNPTIFPEADLIVSAGNFHGEPIAMPMDYLCLALTELSNISERRIYKLIGGTRGLPSFLVAKPGINSGFMIAQYAAASILNQSKSLCWPSSCDSIPSSQGQEDHVSMGSNSATKLLRVVDNTRRILAIELMTSAQALEFRRPLMSSPVVEALHSAFRAAVPFVDVDTVMYPLLQRSEDFLRRTTFC